MKTLSNVGLLATVAGLATGVAAQSAEMSSMLQGNPEHEGFYITGSGGYQVREQSTDIGLGTAAQFHDGFLVNGGVGYRFPYNIRLEAEVGYQNNKNDKFVNEGSFLFATAGAPIGSTQPSVGNVGLRSFMVNVYYDLSLGEDSKWKPYFGGGVGVYQSQINGFTSAEPGGALAANGIAISTSSRETFAWQIRAGIAYRIIERGEIFAGYRYFHGDDLKFTFYIPPGAFPGAIPGGMPAPGLQSPLNVTGGITHGAEFGFRFFF